MTTQDHASKPKVFSALTGLRGLGALWVTLFHLFDGSTIILINKGYLGVDLFFILSGFILSHVHAKDFPVYTYRAHIKFLQLRLARIYPLHVFILVCFALFVFNAPGFAERYTNPERLDIGHFFAALFLVHNWGIGPAPLWNGPTWSLSAEWFAYLTFPLISIFCVKHVPTKWVLVGAFAVLATLEAIMLWKGIHGGMGKAGLLRMAAEFTAGCLLYRYCTLKGVDARSLPYLLLSLALLSAALYGPSLISLASVGFALLILAVVGPPNLASRMLSSRALVWLGEISFSLYLCHWPLIQVRNWITPQYQIPNNISLVILIAAIALTSLLCYIFIEKPARNFGRKFITHS